MSILYPEQQPIADKMYSSLDACELFNIPTGRGKTFILLDVAKKAMEEGKRVIISVPNNYLVREMYSVALKHFNLNKSNTVIKIGRDNYISRTRLETAVKSETIYEFCEKESLDKYLDKYIEDEYSDNLFFDDFNREVEYKDIATEVTVRQLICYGLSDNMELDFSKITLTNHYYLLSKGVYDTGFDIGEFTLLIDEVHEIADVAETIMSDSFSMFEYKNALSLARREIAEKEDFHGKIKLQKMIKTQEVKAYRHFTNNLCKEKVGEYVTTESEIKPIIDATKDILTASAHSYLEVALPKAIPFYANMFAKHKKIAPFVTQREEKNSYISFGVYYSPSKGYPTLRTSTSNPLGKLNHLFWDKVTSFCGVSGSVTSSFSPTEDEIKYGYSRLGMLRKEDKRTIHFFERTFPKENINVFLPTNELFEGISKDSVYSEKFDEENSPYYEKIVDEININHKNKNTIVLCGGYKEAKYLSELYRLKYNDTIIDCANTKEKVFTTVEKFKKNGGILFATKNYGTGLSLEGKLLEKLFIIKFPYPDFTSKKWQELKMRSAGLFRKLNEREMIISLMQNLGRVPRTAKDEGSIIILDYRYSKTKAKVRDKIDEVCSEYGRIKRSTKSEKKVFKKDFSDQMDELF